MSFFSPQNPGIGGLDELTTAEELVIQSIASLTGNSLKVLRVNVGETGVEWTTLAAGGDVSKVGTPVNNQVGVWTGDGTLEGDTALTFDTATDTLSSGILNATSMTASELTATDASKNLVSLAVATYPSLTEISYVKGVTSAIQTQIGTKAPSTAPTFATSITGSYLTASEMLITDGSKNIVSAPVATYPSLTELSYVKGVTSAIQTQLNTKGIGDMVLASVQSVTGLKTFDTTKLAVKGSSTGSTAIASANAGATDYTQTLQAKTGTIANSDDTFYIGTTQVALNRASAALTLAGLTLTTPDIGTPSAGVLTNATGLPAASVIAGILGVTGTRMTKLWATDIESTNMPTVGGTAILTSLTAPQFTTIELGAATDTTLSRVSAGVVAVEGVTVPTISSTSTLTNKRIEPRIVSATSYTTDTGTSLDVSTTDTFVITAQAGALLFNAPGGTPVQGQSLVIRIKDNGTARALTWNAVYRAMGNALPSTTVLSKTLYLGFFYNSTDTKWDLVASAQEA